MSSPENLPSLPQQPQPTGALALRPSGALQTQLLAQQQEADAQDSDEIDLKAIFRTLLKHKWTIVGTTALCTLAAVVYTLRVTPQYQSTALLQIDRAAQKVVGFNAEVEVDQGAAADQLQLRTQIELLKSRSLTERVIDEMGLYKPESSTGLPEAPESEPGRLPGEADAEKPGFVALLGNNLQTLFKPSSDDERLLGRSATIASFERSVTVEPIRNSRLVEIKVLNADPELAARIANTMAKAFIASNIERKVDSSVYARQFLEDQIKQTKAKLEESERQINDYAKKNEILNLGDKGSAATQTFVDFSAALGKAQQDRIKAETQYNEVKRNPDSAPQALDNAAIQAYKEQKAKLEAEYAKNLATYKPEFPTMVQARAQIGELNSRIKAEVDTILASIKGQFEAAKQQEEALRAKVASTRSEVISVQDRSVDMNLLQRELETNRQVYDALLQRLKEVSVTAGITTNNVSIVDEATASLFPAKPKPLVNLALGLVLGVFLGMLAALLREQMDDSIKHADEIEGTLGLPLLGLIPMTKQEKGSEESIALLAHREPRSGFAEAYRSMRTALQFSTADGAPKRFMVTSCGKSEGKTTTAIALAINFAQLGQRVLLIDADMRKSAVHKALRMPNERGLSNLLSGDRGSEMLIQPTVIPNLSVLLAGPTPPDPVELLMGPKLAMLMQKAQELGFAQVVIDGPPLLGIADAVVLGNQIQHVVFAVKASSTKKDSIKDAMRRLRNAGIAPMGVVLTHARNEHSSDYAYESYYGYGDAHTPRAAKPQPAPGTQPAPLAASTRAEPTLGPTATAEA
ncbi:GumC family protein [Hydrogenophaga sp. ZJX-1]|uniref:GumC family protein n=1 Tax=Hydrogenophaga sp. ZJX-1 TaxID=3404778 RepID=UPI003B28506C